ncbi:MAG TPA: hypothetical protein VFE82_05115 [Ramlibacter sp.]|uniref:hypothetical protein n=1 Tax=Ramlibacter sp. TaxID=1917967 RepID=UPI002D259AC4|nr:hypothetical protein [Ramlibacter sp.]HZY17839.1 hypothetical protein [Ramlibacter sp.]
MTWPDDPLRRAAADAASTAWRPRLDRALLLLALAVVIGVRVHLLRSTDFPINDGALFLSFIEAIVPVFPALPDTVAFSGLSIPFAYPPLSFWLAAAAVRLGADPLAIVHRVPILMNTGYVLLFAALLRRTGHSRLFTATAVLVFGTTFLSYEWLVMGGGLSRGLGSLFLLLTLLVLMPAVHGRGPAWSPARLLVAGACVGAAVLSHLEWGLLAAFSAAACAALTPLGAGARARAAATVGVAAAAVAGPWFLSVVGTHGLEPFLAAARTGSLQGLGAAPGGAMKVAGAIGVLLPFVLLGAIVVARTRDVFWLLFVAAALLLTPRGGRTPMLLALGVLAASGLLTSVALLRHWAGPRRQRSATAAAALLVAALLVARTMPAMRADDRFAVLPRELREAMAWVAAHHPGSRFAVLNDRAWYYNASAEWFPVLARAVNTTTVQGREWLPHHDFRRAELAVGALNASSSCEQLLRHLESFARSDFIWVEAVDLRARAAGATAAATAGPEAGALRGPASLAGCFDRAGYEEVHANARVRIFRATAGPSR